MGVKARMDQKRISKNSTLETVMSSFRIAMITTAFTAASSSDDALAGAILADVGGNLGIDWTRCECTVD